MHSLHEMRMQRDQSFERAAATPTAPSPGPPQRGRGRFFRSFRRLLRAFTIMRPAMALSMKRAVIGVPS